MTPSGPAILAEVAVVLLACVAMAVSARIAWTTRNGLHWFCVVGATLLVLGVVGQRSYPNPDQQAVISSETSANHALTVHPGIWEAGIGLPFVGTVTDDQGRSRLGINPSAIMVTPVAVVGMLAWLVAVALVLVLEYVPTHPARREALHPALEHDDSA